LQWTVLKAMCSTLILTVTARYSYIGLRRVCDIRSVFHLRTISFPLNKYWTWKFTITVVLMKNVHVVIYW
jgi:hypothetical protein